MMMTTISTTNLMRIFTLCLCIAPQVTLAQIPTMQNDLPTDVTETNPLRVFLQAGQSECKGAASASMLTQDSATYPDLIGPQDGVWFAGHYDTEGFLIRPMNAGEPSFKNNFGPEVSFGRRLNDASNDDSPILIVKYCWGGSNVHTQWNPITDDNNWDRSMDDGSAAWLLADGAANLDSKQNLYGTLIYTVRLAVETLNDASIPFVFSGLIWIQGSGDKKRTWFEYGTDLTRLFETVRSDINEPDLPIIDAGADVHHNLISAKMYADSIIDNGNKYTSLYASAAANPDSDCVPGPSNPCPGDTFINFDVFEFYGYDPAFFNSSFVDMLPANHTNKTFSWFKSYPTNVHSEYEGMILHGRRYANDFIRQFASDWATLTTDMEEDDPALLFPFEACADGEKPNASNICWMDQRSDTIFPTSPPISMGPDIPGFIPNPWLPLLRRLLTLLRQVLQSFGLI